MTYRVACATALALTMASAVVAADGEFKNGLQSKPSVKKISAFNPKHCSGPNEGKSNCLV